MKRKATIQQITMTALAVFGLVFSSEAATEGQVDRSAENVVRFISDAPFEDFEGVTSEIDGYVYWEKDTLSPGTGYDNSKIYFEVLLSDLETGIGMRDRDMREDYLETGKYPYAKFEGTIGEVRRKSDSSVVVWSSGTMTIHGVTNDLTLQSTVTLRNGAYRIESQFPIRLGDYKIEVPQMLFMRISETVEVELDFVVTRAER